MLIFDTIVALSTPPYKSALAIVRLSGPKSLEIISHMIKKDVSSLQPNHCYFLNIYKDKDNKDSLIDEIVLSFFKGPKSYTGFDSLEFSTHGSQFIVDELIQALVSHGARRAEKGEFSAQAYYNGKMDLLKAQGINDLINANSKRAKAIATKTLSGKNSQTVNNLKDTLLEYLSQLEYFVEDQYSDEKDDYDQELDKINLSLEKNCSDLEKTIEKTQHCNKEYQGINVAIAGEPNVGKSTLLNALIGENKAIVSPIPGTTRDVVEGEKEINGILFRFKDTAGLRKTDDFVESLGIEKSYETISKSDIVLLASDCGFEEIDSNPELLQVIGNKPTIRIATKKDINKNLTGSDIAICSINDSLESLIEMMFSKLDLTHKEESEFLGKREEDFLINILSDLRMTQKAICDTHQIDIVSDSLRVAIECINDLLGNQVTKTMEDIYQTLFSKFCLGK
ncbi:MAG: tRNA uridine-5-carboxymethylaminomethyl(34) synthesis GTPase MnmE [Bacilli bacterium]